MSMLIHKTILSTGPDPLVFYVAFIHYLSLLKGIINAFIKCSTQHGNTQMYQCNDVINLVIYESALNSYTLTMMETFNVMIYGQQYSSYGCGTGGLCREDIVHITQLYSWLQSNIKIKCVLCMTWCLPHLFPNTLFYCRYFRQMMILNDHLFTLTA